jgi:hypothetical protein
LFIIFFPQQFFYQSKVLKEFSDKIYNDSLPWVLPVMAVLTNDFRRLALHLYGIGGINEQQLKNSYTSVLQPIFTQTMNCRLIIIFINNYNSSVTIRILIVEVKLNTNNTLIVNIYNNNSRSKYNNYR